MPSQPKTLRGHVAFVRTSASGKASFIGEKAKQPKKDNRKLHVGAEMLIATPAGMNARLGREFALKITGKHDKDWQVEVMHSAGASQVGKKYRLPHAILQAAAEHAKAFVPKTDAVELEEATKKPFRPGEKVYFKREGVDKKHRSGTVKRQLGRNLWVIEGKAQGGTAQGDIHALPAASLLSEKNYAKLREKLDGGTGRFENVGGTRNTLTTKELNRRAEASAAKTSLTEDQILTSPAFQGMMKRTVISLATGNRMHPGDVRLAGGVWLSDENFEFNDLVSEYMVSATSALRRELARAPQAEIEAFEAQIKGDDKDADSRIFKVITKQGRGAVINILKERAERHKRNLYIDEQPDGSRPVQLQDKTNGIDAMDYADFASDIDQDETWSPVDVQRLGYIREREAAIEGLVSTLSPTEQEVVNRRYGLGAFVEPQSAAEIASAMKTKKIAHPAGKTWHHESVLPVHDTAIETLKQTQGIDEYRRFLRAIKDHLDMIKSHGPCKVLGRGIVFRSVGGHYVLEFASEALAKSYSSDMQEKYPGGRWITVREPGSPLYGRHLFILQHKGGTATILSGGGPAMRHKVLKQKREDEVGKKDSADARGEKPSSATEAKEPPKKPELIEERRAEIEATQAQHKADIKAERARIADIVRSSMGKEVELTADDRAKIEAKVKDIADPKQRAIEKQRETVRVKTERDQALNEIIKQAKTMVLHESSSAEGQPATVSAAVKENAEQLLNHYYKIKAQERENKEIRRALRAGEEKKTVADAVKFQPLTKEELQRVVSGEAMREKELEAHYRLVSSVRGYVDADGTEHKVKGGARLEQNIGRGGYEAMTGMVGEMTGNAIMSSRTYDTLGPRNAAVLAHYYLRNSGMTSKKVVERLHDDLSKIGGEIAQRAVNQGDSFMAMADRVRATGFGEDNLMEAAQAHGAALKYQNRAYEVYAQAEGALNQAAELAYEAANGKGRIEFKGRGEASFERIRKVLKLKASDVKIEKHGTGDYTMVVKPSAYEKLITESATARTGGVSGEGFSLDDIKLNKANTDDFHPSGIREFTPADKQGNSKAIMIEPHQQAAIRFLEKQKRAYLNYEAGTGKSLTIIATKAHLDDVHGKQHKMIVSMPSGGKGALLHNFAKEVQKFSGYKVAVIDPSDTPAQRKAKYNSGPDTIVVVNHEKMNFDEAMIREAKFDVVAADEAHTITQRDGGGKSMKSEGLKNVALEAPYYAAMSGTPTPADVSQLYFHAHLMNPEKFSNLAEFKAKYGNVHRGGGMKEKISDFMNRELADHVITSRQGTLLKPDGTPVELRAKTTFVKLSPKQRDEYRATVADVKSGKISQLQAENRYKQNLNDTHHAENAKFAEVKKIVDHHLATKGPTEKLSLYVDSINGANNIHDFLEKNYPGMGVVRFTNYDRPKPGEASGKAYRADEKAQFVTNFKHDPAVKFSIHTRTGTTGFNIQHDGDGGGATTLVALASGEASFATVDQFRRRGYRFAANRDVDFHQILTDTPYDLGTETRLGDQERLQRVIKAQTGIYLLRGDIAKAARALHGAIDFHGLQISVENRAGSVRQWKDDSAGTEGMTRMARPYGYIKGTLGTDGDHYDVFVGPHRDAQNVYIVSQMKAPDFTEPDEEKALLGFPNQGAARRFYLQHYDDPRFLGKITAMPLEDFRVKVMQTRENGGKPLVKSRGHKEYDRHMASGKVVHVEAKGASHPTFKTYAEAYAHIKRQKKKHGARKYVGSEEYAAIYPHVTALYKEQQRAQRDRVSVAIIGTHYPDGRLVPQVGDKVFQMVPGMFGLGAVINGEVISGGKVKVTGANSMLGTGETTRKTYPLTPDWSVVDDPEFDRRKAEKERKEAERESERQNERRQYVSEGAARFNAALHAGEKPLTVRDASVGMRVTNHNTGKVMTITEVDGGNIYVDGGFAGRMENNGDLSLPYPVLYTFKPNGKKKLAKSAEALCKQIGDSIGVNWNKVDLDEFCNGMFVEMEHADITGGDSVATAKIVLAHLKERRDYYSRLDKYVEKAISGLYLLRKSHVKSHTRRTKGGLVVQVKEHDDKRLVHATDVYGRRHIVSLNDYESGARKIIPTFHKDGDRKVDGGIHRDNIKEIHHEGIPRSQGRPGSFMMERWGGEKNEVKATMHDNGNVAVHKGTKGWTISHTHTGKKIQDGFKTKYEAEAALAESLARGHKYSFKTQDEANKDPENLRNIVDHFRPYSK